MPCTIVTKMDALMYWSTSYIRINRSISFSIGIPDRNKTESKISQRHVAKYETNTSFFTRQNNSSYSRPSRSIWHSRFLSSRMYAPGRNDWQLQALPSKYCMRRKVSYSNQQQILPLVQMSTALNLHESHIGPLGIQQLAEALRQNTVSDLLVCTSCSNWFVQTVTTLDISRNRIGPSTIKYLADTLTHNKVAITIIASVSGTH